MPRQMMRADRLFAISTRSGHLLGVADLPEILEIAGWCVPPQSVVDRVGWTVDPALYDQMRGGTGHRNPRGLLLEQVERIELRVSSEDGSRVLFTVPPNATVVVQADPPIDCEACDGTGRGAISGMRCPDCLGTGRAR